MELDCRVLGCVINKVIISVDRLFLGSLSLIGVKLLIYFKDEF